MKAELTGFPDTLYMLGLDEREESMLTSDFWREQMEGWSC